MDFSKLPKGILFDLDDTIIASRSGTKKAWLQACDEQAVKSNLFVSSMLFNEIENVRRWYWSDEYRQKLGVFNLHDIRRYIVGLAFKNMDLNDKSLSDNVARSIPSNSTFRSPNSCSPIASSLYDSLKGANFLYISK